MDWISGLIGIVGILCLFMSYACLQGRKKEIRMIYEQLRQIQEKQKDEKVMLFTEHKEIKQLLEIINEILEEKQKRKITYIRMQESMKKMLSNISHDIKTPLTVIAGYLEMMELHEEKDQIQKESIKKLGKKVDQVIELIEQFFTLAKLESGDMKLKCQPIEVCEGVRTCLLDFYEILTEQEIEVEVSIPEEKLWIQGDEQALERILVNLFSNALRYGSDGNYLGVKVWQEEGNVCFCVCDRGKGIPTYALEHIFERLYTMEDSRNREIQGNGLGLTIVKNLVEKMGGFIEVTSVPMKETKFLVRIPKADDLSKKEGEERKK